MATSDVVVVEGTVDSTDQLARYTSSDSDTDQDQPGIFTDYMIHNHYINNKRRYQLGITSPGGFQGNSVAFVQLASPTTLVISEWTALKWNSQPQVPDPENGIPPNWVLLEVRPTTARIDLGLDGTTPRYRISGVYVYGLRSPNVQPYQDVNFPRPPWIGDVVDRSMPDSKLQTNLMTGVGTVVRGAGQAAPGKPAG